MKTRSAVLGGLLALALVMACSHSGQMDQQMGPPTPVAEERLKSVVDGAIAQLSNRLAVEPTQIAVLSVQAVEWPDTSLGVPEPGKAYAQVITPGYRVRLKVGGKVYEIHGDHSGRLVMASDPDVAARPAAETKLRAFLEYWVTRHPEQELAEVRDWVLEDAPVPGLGQAQTWVWRVGDWSISISSPMSEEDAIQVMLAQDGDGVLWRGTLRPDGQFVCEEEPLPGDLGVVFRSLMGYFDETYPGFGLAQPSDWTYHDVTPPELVGASTHKWQNGEWSLVLSHLDATQPAYSLLLTHARAATVWRGTLQPSGQVISDQPVLLSVEVGPCDEGMEVDSLADWAGIDFEVDDGLVYITQRLRYVCCAELALAAGRDGSVIKVVETNIGQVCRCICGYALAAELNGLQPGAHTIEVWGVQHVSGQPLELLGSAEVSIE